MVKTHAQHIIEHFRAHPKRMIILGSIILFHVLLIIGLLSNTSKEPPMVQATQSSLAVTMIAPPPPEPVTPPEEKTQDYVQPAPVAPTEPSPLEQISHQQAQKKVQPKPEEKPQPVEPPPPPPPPVKAPVHSHKKSKVYSKKKVQTPPAQTSSEQGSTQPSQGNGVSDGQGQGTGMGDGPAGTTPLNGAKLIYPPEMEAENVEGRVTVLCDVLVSGYTKNCVVKGVSGGDAFAKSAMDYLSRARFKPAIQHGAPVIDSQKVFVIRYRLDE